MSCVSGGNLATTVFTYYNRGASGVASSDEELLGVAISGAELTLDSINSLSPLNMGNSITTTSPITMAILNTAYAYQLPGGSGSGALKCQPYPE